MAEVLAAREAARLTDFARAFKAAARAVVLYPDAHPAIATTLERLTHLTTPPHLASPFRFSVSGDALLVGGLAAPRQDAAITELAALLHSHLIGEVTVHPDGDEASWRTFLLLLGRAPDAVRAEGGIARAWTTLAGRHVDLREIDYAEVLRERNAGTAASWQQIIASCLAGSTFEIPEDLLASLLDGVTDSDALADVIATLEAAAIEAGCSVHARAAALVRLLRGIVTAVTAAASHRTEPVLRDLAMALGRTSPDLILSMLEQGGDGPNPDAAMVGSVLSRMPDGTVASFVARHAVGGVAPIERVAQAFQALVVDHERRERLVTMAHDTAIVSGAEGDAFEESWQGIAEKLLSQYSDEPFVSERYARELTTVRAQAVQLDQLQDDPPERLAAWLGTVATTELRRLDLALVLDLLHIEHDTARREALMAPVVSLIDDLFLVGDFESAAMILEVLRADAAHGADDARRLVAREAMGRLVTTATMRHIVGHLSTVDDAQFARVKSICLSLGETLVRPLAEALSVEERTRTRGRLTDILLGFGAVGRREVEQLKTSVNPAVRRTAIHLLREFGGSEALPDLTELLDDAEPVVQREAVRAILKIGTDQGYRILEQALASGTPQSREAIMQALGSPRDERAAPLLVYILEHVGHTGSLGWVYARALDLLGQLRDPQAVDALRNALYRGEWWAPRRSAALRRAAASALSRIDSSAAVDALIEATQRGPRGVRRAARAQLDRIASGRTVGGRA
ncbi:MAG TPA: HEAT repeat domain-containing protein [Vicinamibacterales bacterium]|nr:HEAT repeat domain-containing protein [Vicinamibacterales bacterium]